jgi:hypothetical protein
LGLLGRCLSLTLGASSELRDFLGFDDEGSLSSLRFFVEDMALDSVVYVSYE